MTQAELPPELDAALSRIERQLDAMDAAVGQGDAAAVESLGGVLRQVVADFSQLVEGRHAAFSNPGVQRRLKQIAQNLASQRESLIRRSASVERALHALIPATESATYVPPSGAASFGPGRRRYEA
jgi:hypothetical protein